MFTQPLIIGSTYRLKFKSTFERHGVCSTPGVTCLHAGGGVFRLEQITNFRDLVLAGVKLYDIFFSPLGITSDEYQAYFNGKPDDTYTPEYATTLVENLTSDSEMGVDATGLPTVKQYQTVTHHEVHVETGKSLLKKHYKDNVNYASFPIYKFVDVIDSNDVLWVPELTIAEFPEIDIKEYRDLSLVMHLGYLTDPTILDPMLLSVRERMAAYGWLPKNIKLYTTDSKWMSPAEYDAVKKLRVPATIETIDDLNYEEMIGEYAIVSGNLKKIVKPNSEGNVEDPESEISIESIRKHKQNIDNRLFLVKCKDGDTFATGDNYYVETTKMSGNTEVACLKLLTEGIDYNSGDACVTYRLATDSDKSQRYTKVEGDYMEVPYGHNGDYSVSSLVRKVTTDRYVKTADIRPYYSVTKDLVRDKSKTYYVPTAAGSTVMREAIDSDFDSTGAFVVNVKYYEKNSKSYYVYSGSNFILATSDYFTEDGGFITDVNYYELDFIGAVSYTSVTEDEIADPSIVMYIKQPDAYNKDNAGLYVRVFDENDVAYTKVYRESYSTVEAMRLMGYKFDFDDSFGQPKTITLQLEDIIENGTNTTNVVLPSADKDYDKFWSRYDGRKFRWVEYNDPSDVTLSETFETVVSEDSKTLLSEKAGMLLGETGQVSKEVYVKDSQLQQRNYYMKYVIQSQQINDLKNRIASLERALIESQAKLAELTNNKD